MTKSTISQIITNAKKAGRNLLTEGEAKQVLQAAGLKVTETKLAQNEEEAVAIFKELGFPVALKIVSPDIIHKTDANGVKLNLKKVTEVKKAFADIMVSAKKMFPRANLHGVSVQKMRRPGTEIIIGMSQDARFGPVLMFGMGGIFVEILKYVAFGIRPLTKRDAREMIKEIKGYPLLKGYRG